MSSQIILSGPEAMSPEAEFRFIAPHPYSSNIERSVNGELSPSLSILSRIAIDAAVTAWQAHPDAKLVIAGETCYKGLPTTTDLMVERAKDISNITDTSIVALNVRPDGQNYNNTYLQTEGLADYFRSVGADTDVLSLSLDYHIKRIRMTAKAFHWHPAFVTCEDVLHSQDIHQYDEYLPYIAELEKSERILRLVNRVDRQGRLFNIMMRRSGPRMVDVVRGDDGDLQLLQTYSSSREESVLANS